MRSRSKEITTHSVSATKSKANLTTKHIYFCHYRNGMYMGEAKNFQKHGLGILIHDTGTSILSNYHQDMLHDINLIIYKDGSLASAKFNKDKLAEVLYKGSSQILFIRYTKGLADGGSILVDLKNEEIVYTNYRMGQILCKCTENDPVLRNRVFTQKNYMSLFPKDHVLNLDFNLKYHDEIYISKRTGKIVIGYSKDRMMLNGLGVILINKNTSSSSHEFEVLESGYYKNMQLSGFGHRNFKNGNYYSGEFKYDQFEGSGILKNIHKQNWVCGNFQRGTLVQLLTYGDQADEKAVNKAIECIHQKKTSWVNRQILVPHQNIFLKEINLISRFKDYGVSRIIQTKKSDVLRKIQQNFMTDEDVQHKNIFEQLKPNRKDIYQDLEESLNKQRRVQTIEDYYLRSLDTPYTPLINQQSPNTSSRKRNRIFDSNSSRKNPEIERSFRRQSPIPIQNSKEIQSRVSFVESPAKEIRMSFGRLPPPSYHTPVKPKPSDEKARSTSTAYINKTINLNLIDLKYRKSNRDKLY